MSSLDVMLSMSSQLGTYIAEVQDEVTLSVNAFEFWHARVALHGLLRTYLCACIAGLCGTHLFCMWAAPFWTMKRYVQLSPDESLSKTQSESAERSLLCIVTVFQRLSAANVTDLCIDRNSLAQ